MRRVLIAVLLVALVSAAFAQRATSPFEAKVKTETVEAPRTNIKLMFCAYQTKDHEADANAGWDAFCHTIGAAGTSTITDVRDKGGHKGFVGKCSMSLTNAQIGRAHV